MSVQLGVQDDDQMVTITFCLQIQAECVVLYSLVVGVLIQPFGNYPVDAALDRSDMVDLLAVAILLHHNDFKTFVD